MNRKTLITQLHKKIGLTKADTKKVFDITLDIMLEALYNGENITLHDFGTFSIIQHAPKMGVNPKTHEPLQVKGFKTIKFKPSESVKKVMNNDL